MPSRRGSASTPADGVSGPRTPGNQSEQGPGGVVRRALGLRPCVRPSVLRGARPQLVRLSPGGATVSAARGGGRMAHAMDRQVAAALEPLAALDPPEPPAVGDVAARRASAEESFAYFASV